MKKELKKALVDDAVRILGNIPHIVNDNNTIAIPSPVGAVMLYPTTYKIQLGSVVRDLGFPLNMSEIKCFIDEMVNERV